MSDADEFKVLEGKDGYLFLTGDGNRVVDQVEGRYPFDDRKAWAIAMVHAARQRFCEMLGATYSHVVVPDRERVLAELLPDSVTPERCGVRPLDRYREAGTSELHRIRFEPSLLVDGDPNVCFSKTDTHWTFEGAERYARMIVASAGADPHTIELGDAAEHFYENPGDLGAKIGRPPERMRLLVSPDPALRPVYDNRLLNMGRLRITQNEDRDPVERWIVLHDSFGELLTLLLPLCAAKICFIHTADFDEVFVRRFRPNRVVMLQIERFFVREPWNGVNWHDLIAESWARKTIDGSDMPILTDEVAFS